MAHVRAHCGVALVKRRLGPFEHTVEIFLACTKARGAKEEDLLAPQLLQQTHRRIIGNALVRPKADVEELGLGILDTAIAKVIAMFCRKRVADRLRELLGVAGVAAKDDRVVHAAHGATCLSLRVDS